MASQSVQLRNKDARPSPTCAAAVTCPVAIPLSQDFTPMLVVTVSQHDTSKVYSYGRFTRKSFDKKCLCTIGIRFQIDNNFSHGTTFAGRGPLQHTGVQSYQCFANPSKVYSCGRFTRNNLDNMCLCTTGIRFQFKTKYNHKPTIAGRGPLQHLGF